MTDRREYTFHAQCPLTLDHERHRYKVSEHNDTVYFQECAGIALTEQLEFWMVRGGIGDQLYTFNLDSKQQAEKAAKELLALLDKYDLPKTPIQVIKQDHKYNG